MTKIITTITPIDGGFIHIIQSESYDQPMVQLQTNYSYFFDLSTIDYKITLGSEDESHANCTYITSNGGFSITAADVSDGMNVTIRGFEKTAARTAVMTIIGISFSAKPCNLQIKPSFKFKISGTGEHRFASATVSPIKLTRAPSLTRVTRPFQEVGSDDADTGGGENSTTPPSKKSRLYF